MLDELRRSDFARLDRGGHVYLDYTGGGLYAESQLREHMRLLERGVFGNPHSINPTSAASTELVERARASVLEFFNASPEEYVAIFTAERHRRAAAGRRGVPVPPRRPVPAHLRQPQLRQRDPRVRPRAGRRDHVRAERGARSARRRGAAAALPDRHRRRSPQPVRLPGAVELLRRSAPAGMDRAGPRRMAGTCCSTPPRTSRPTGWT